MAANSTNLSSTKLALLTAGAIAGLGLLYKLTKGSSSSSQGSEVKPPEKPVLKAGTQTPMSVQLPLTVPSDATELTITSLHVYPVKSCGGVSLPTAALDAAGLTFDRRWMVVLATPEESGVHKFITQRQAINFALIRTDIDVPARTVTLTSPNSTEPLVLRLPPPRGTEPSQSDVDEPPRTPVKIWRSELEGIDEGDEAANWFQTALAAPDLGPVRLIRTSEAARRTLPPPISSLVKSGYTQVLSWPDAYPILVASSASLKAVNEAMAALDPPEDPIGMERFRPNVVVDGAPEAWDEDNWVALVSSGKGKKAPGSLSSSGIWVDDETNDVKTLDDEDETSSASSSGSSSGSESETQTVFVAGEPCRRCIVTTIDQEKATRNPRMMPLKLLKEIHLDEVSKMAMFGWFFLPVTPNHVLTVGDKLMVAQRRSRPYQLGDESVKSEFLD